MLLVRTTHGVSSQRTTAPVSRPQLAAGLVLIATEGVVRTELGLQDLGSVECRHSPVTWPGPQSVEEELVACSLTPGGPHVTGHTGGTAVHLVLAAGGLWVGTAPDTFSRRQRTAGLAIRTGVLLVLLAPLSNKKYEKRLQRICRPWCW